MRLKIHLQYPHEVNSRTSKKNLETLLNNCRQNRTQWGLILSENWKVIKTKSFAVYLELLTMPVDKMTLEQIKNELTWSFKEACCSLLISRSTQGWMFFTETLTRLSTLRGNDWFSNTFFIFTSLSPERDFVTMYHIAGAIPSQRSNINMY